MSRGNPLSVQCFVKKDYESVFVGDNVPKLLFISEQQNDASKHPRMMHAHAHHVEMVLICSGESDYLIGTGRHHIKKGDLLIYNSNVVHDEVSGPGNEIFTYCMGIGGLHMPGLRENALIPDDAGYVYHTGDDFETMRGLCEMMFDRLSRNRPQAEGFCYHLMCALLVMALNIVNADGNTQSAGEDPAEKSELGQRVMDYIDHHFMDDVTLPDISRALHVSTYYMSHVFKEMSGYSPMQYLLRRRIGEAQTLLITTDLSVTEIAQRVGYETQSYFNQQFSRHVGMPPKRYRQNYIVGKQKKSGKGKSREEGVNDLKKSGDALQDGRDGENDVL